MQVKKFANYKEQVENIEKKGFVVDNEHACLEFLKQVNYYRLSAYFLPFKVDEKNYIHGITFTQIQNIYDFDRRMRLLILSVIEEVELYLRSGISYYHAKKYGALGYLNKESFGHDMHNHVSFLHRIQESCINKNKKNPIIRHHAQKYNNKLPLWVLIDFFSIGMISRFYSDMHRADKNFLARSMFSTKYAYLDSWLKCLTVLRNKCAHYSRLYYLNFTDIPKMPRKLMFEPSGKLFDQLLMLKFMHKDHNQWDTKFIIPLRALIDQYIPYIKLCDIGFPENWEELLSY